VTIRFSKESVEDLKKIRAWYIEISESVLKKFVVEFESSLSLIKKEPLLSIKYKRNIYRKLMKRYPYSIYYEVEDKFINIIAVLHNSRDITDI
jgi:plasmid stabilization system protein ParE